MEKDQPVRYKILSLDLNTARTKKEFEIPGGNLTVLFMDGTADLRLNHNTADAISLIQKSATQHTCKRIESHFNRFYITNSSQSGKTLTLAIGEKNFKLMVS